MQDHHDDPATYPALGRMLTWVDKPGSAIKLVWLIAAICLGLFLFDFTYKKYGHFDVEKIQGFYGAFGFVLFTDLILAAKTLRIFIKRDEDYYLDKSVDREAYPEDQLDRKTVGDDNV